MVAHRKSSVLFTRHKIILSNPKFILEQSLVSYFFLHQAKLSEYSLHPSHFHLMHAKLYNLLELAINPPALSSLQPLRLLIMFKLLENYQIILGLQFSLQ